MKQRQQGFSNLELLVFIVGILGLAAVIVAAPYGANARNEVLEERWAPRLASATTPQKRAMVEAIKVEVGACSTQEDLKRSPPVFKNGWRKYVEANEPRCFDLLAARLALNADPAAAQALIAQLKTLD